MVINRVSLILGWIDFWIKNSIILVKGIFPKELLL
jgi:hypothetical protein